MLPNFIVIGAQKAGSTWVAEVLAHHPDVYMYPTELPFFENPDFQGRDVAWLESHFTSASTQRAVGMKRPNLLGLPECPAHIKQVVPDARLIAMLRNPVERAVSAYFHLMRSGLLPITPMEHGLRQIISGAWDAKWPAARINVLQYGFYGAHVQRYLEHFPREQLLVLIYDQIHKQADVLFSNMCAFLGVRSIERPKALEKRVMTGAYSTTRLRVLAPLQPWHRRISPDRMRVHLRRGPVAQAFRVVARGVDQLLLERMFACKRPTPSVELQQQLIELYADDVSALGAFLGEDLSHWLRPRTPAKT